ncbi:MAG: hypothetical protein GY909_15250 [Oligoflexia bacterium]|nr:hypothetical protein [Oligoflexia bacterium]
MGAETIGDLKKQNEIFSKRYDELKKAKNLSSDDLKHLEHYQGALFCIEQLESYLKSLAGGLEIYNQDDYVINMTPTTYKGHKQRIGFELTFFGAKRYVFAMKPERYPPGRMLEILRGGGIPVVFFEENVPDENFDPHYVFGKTFLIDNFNLDDDPPICELGNWEDWYRKWFHQNRDPIDHPDRDEVDRKCDRKIKLVTKILNNTRDVL